MTGFELHVPLGTIAVLDLGAAIDGGDDNGDRGLRYCLLRQGRDSKVFPDITIPEALESMRIWLVVIAGRGRDQVDLERIEPSGRWCGALPGRGRDSLGCPQQLRQLREFEREEEA